MCDSKLDKLLEIQKWKVENLYKIIDSKETKKFHILKVGYGTFGLMITLFITVAMILARFTNESGVIDKDYFKGLYFSLVFLTLSATIVNYSIMRFVSALKSDVLLATRQLNCLRASIHAITYEMLHGEVPENEKNPLKSENIKDTKYYKLMGSHAKYPLDNESLRSTYFSEDGGKMDYKALYRSSDLFSMTMIMLFTILLSGTTIAVGLSYVNIFDVDADDVTRVINLFYFIQVVNLVLGVRIIYSLLKRATNSLKSATC